MNGKARFPLFTNEFTNDLQLLLVNCHELLIENHEFLEMSENVSEFVASTIA